MGNWIGDSNHLHGPLVLSAHDLAGWQRRRDRAREALASFQREQRDAPPAIVDVDGAALVLPGGCATAWHPRPWGGFLARMLELENVIAQDAGAT